MNNESINVKVFYNNLFISFTLLVNNIKYNL